MMKKIGLLGGAFDPIHNAHIQLGVGAKHQLNLDEIWVLIDKQPRNKNTVTPYAHRLDMARAATKEHDFFIVDKLQMQQEGRTYGVKTLEELVVLHPGYSFTLIGGLDAISYFDRWESPEVFCRYVEFAVARRPGHDLTQIEDMKNRLGPRAENFRYQLIEIPELPISSTQIRRDLQAGIITHNHLSPDVSRYISSEHLYRS